MKDEYLYTPNVSKKPSTIIKINFVFSKIQNKVKTDEYE